MSVNRRSLLFLFLMVVITTISCLVNVDGYAVTWVSSEGEMELRFPASNIAQSAIHLIIGSKDLTGNYVIRDTAGKSLESGRFAIVHNEDRYVAGYSLISNGHQRTWTQGPCESLADDHSNEWKLIRGPAPIRIEIRGVIAQIFQTVRTAS